MMKKLLAGIGTAMFMLLLVQNAQSEIIDFTGGNAVMANGSINVTNNINTYGGFSDPNGVDYYTQGGFKLDFIGDNGIVGNYYGGGNDVIHGHWSTGWYGTLTEIKISKLDGNTFDLNYFELTSNTDTGGSWASGNELAYVTGYNTAGEVVGTKTLLPPDNWGWSGTNPQVFLDSTFDAIAWASFTVADKVDCFGMDMFYINQAAPPVNNPVPEPSTMLLLGGGLAGLAYWRKRKSA